MNITIEFCIFGISQSTTIQLKLKILIFWTKFTQKSHFWSKRAKLKITIEFCIFELICVPNIDLHWKFWFPGPNLPKKGIFDQSGKSEHHHCIPHIQITRSTKFHFKQTILNVGTKFAKNLNFRSKTKKIEHHHQILHIRPIYVRPILRTSFQLKLAILTWDHS